LPPCDENTISSWRSFFIPDLLRSSRSFIDWNEQAWKKVP
jgi:hypothetical protein